ncbi:hypothetical protein CSHISOI_05444, partial [Colletotrichum shisoi]
MNLPNDGLSIQQSPPCRAAVEQRLAGSGSYKRREIHHSGRAVGRTAKPLGLHARRHARRGVVDRRRIIRRPPPPGSDTRCQRQPATKPACRRTTRPAKPGSTPDSPAAGGGRAWVTGSCAPAPTLDPSGSIRSSSPPIATATLGIDRVVTSHGMRSSKKG